MQAIHEDCTVVRTWFQQWELGKAGVLLDDPSLKANCIRARVCVYTHTANLSKIPYKLRLHKTRFNQELLGFFFLSLSQFPCSI